MTATVEHIAPVVPLHRAPRRPRTAQSRAGLHAQLVAAADRLLGTAAAGMEATAQDALDYFLGALINAVPEGGVLSERAAVALVERTADRLGCPPAALPVAAPDVTALVDAFMDAEGLLSRIATAVGDAKTDLGTSRYEATEARLHSLVEDLACEYGIQVVA